MAEKQGENKQGRPAEGSFCPIFLEGGEFRVTGSLPAGIMGDTPVDLAEAAAREGLPCIKPYPEFVHYRRRGVCGNYGGLQVSHGGGRESLKSPWQASWEEGRRQFFLAASSNLTNRNSLLSTAVGRQIPDIIQESWTIFCPVPSVIPFPFFLDRR